MTGVVFRRNTCLIERYVELCGAPEVTTEVRQDKKPHIAARSVGWFASLFWNFPHIADHEREVRSIYLFSDFRADRTSQFFAP
ncbi:hypothetical protein [Agrobacterium tumefaciens]|uniref:hypothetical protein n=1 Tax=Agrobacterium tumefaciens TaxID=358 RepID=UPI002244088B|nr:hypothetical protein [Agrobacterium tumefaciens]MCW8060854.1 hypothetical protein [Agrobacterium tumefaciens]